MDIAASAGYAVVVQDTRGRFASDGEWDGLSRKMWDLEASDTYDTVEWAGTQPWCDGGVGVWGCSYGGAISWFAGSERPPHLKAIIPEMMGDQSRDHLDFGGAFRLNTYLMFPLFATAMDLPRRLTSGELSMDDAALLFDAMRNLDRALEYLPLRENPYLQLPGLVATVEDVLSGEQGAPSVFAIENVAVPTLVVGGWYDLYPAQTVEQFQRLRSAPESSETLRASHRLLIGPWPHGPLTSVLGELDFGMDATGMMHAHPAHLAFFDQHLKSAEVDLPRVKYFLMGANEWREADDWPPAGTVPQHWYLHSTGHADTDAVDGVLSLTASADEPPDRYRYDPLDPVRTRGGRILGPGPAGPLDQSRVGARPDVLCYTSDVFNETLDIVGLVTLRLHASSSAVDTDFAATLLDVHPDGRAIEVCSGLLRARYRMGRDHETLLEPGAVEEFEINLTHTAMRVLPGHRLRIHVCSSDFPTLDLNMNTGNALGVDAEGVVADQTIYHDATRSSRLEITVLPNG